MCAIVGICGAVATPDRERKVLQMGQTVSYRGPDGRGLYKDPYLVLEHRRLSLIAPLAGDQPIASEDGSLILACNGEVYNHRELRGRLRRAGHSFRTESDVEVLLHGIEEEGIEFLRVVDGMYAFALWNHRSRELLLARDPFGIKPLYYHYNGGELSFGSELKALLRIIQAPLRISASALKYYLMDAAVPDPATIFEETRQVPAGSVLSFNLERCRSIRYWSVPLVGEGAGRPTNGEDDSAAEFENGLKRSLSRCLRADVPVGLFLSGGIDSSLLTMLIPKRRSNGLPTFSVGFKERPFDESAFGSAVSRAAKTEHRIIYLDSDRAADIADTVSEYLDEPFADASVIPTYLVCETARAHVKAVVSGEGADELFGGSPWHDFLRIPRPGFGEEAIPVQRQIFSSAILSELASHDFLAFLNGSSSNVYEQLPCPLSYETIVRNDLLRYLPSDLLRKVDRISMLHSLEVRVPFLNLSVANLVLENPRVPKTPMDIGKVLLRRILRRYLPPAISNRAKKGFSIPIDIWLWKPGRFRDLVYDTLLSRPSLQRGLFRSRALRKLLASHDTLREVNGYRIWTLYTLERWHQNFIDGRA